LLLLFLLLFRRRLLNLFHFIFVSHAKYSPLLKPKNRRHHNITEAALTVRSLFDSAMQFFLGRTRQVDEAHRIAVNIAKAAGAIAYALGHRIFRSAKCAVDR
jgi:hypothetical protein